MSGAASSTKDASIQTDSTRRNAAVAASVSLLLGIYAYAVSLFGTLTLALDPNILVVTPERCDPTYELAVSHGIVGLVGLGAFLVFRKKRVRPLFPRLLLILSPLILLISADRILNVFRPPPLPKQGIYRKDPRRGWAHVPGTMANETVPEYIDRYGLRVSESDWSRELGDGPRLMFLGDSVTFGFAVRMNESFVGVASERLAARAEDPAWEVLDAGVKGYDPAQEYLLLSDRCDDLRPDAIVLQFCFNDVTRQFEAGRTDNFNRHNELRSIRRDPNPSAFVRLAFDWGRKRAFGENLQAAAEHLEHVEMSTLLEQPESEDIRALWDRMLGNADRIAAFCNEKEIPLAVLIFPVDIQMFDPAASLHPQQRLRAFAEKHGLPHLDILQVLESHMPRGPEAAKELFIDTTHPTIRGHAIIGAAVVEFLETSGLLERGRARWKNQTSR